MPKTTLTENDELVHYSRRSLWIGLVLILLLGVPAALSVGFPVAFSACVTVLLGVVVLLASILAYDR